MAITGRTLSLERELRDDLAKITDQHTRDLVRAWATAWDEIAPDLTDTLADLLAGGGPVTQAQLMRSVRLRKSLNEIAISLDRLATSTNITITGRLRQVIDEAGAAQAQLIATQLPAGTIDLDTWTRVDARQLDAIVKRSTKQITSLTKPLSPTAYAAVQRELVRGIAAGSNPTETARRIVARAEGGFNGGLSRALTIARTETLDAHRAGAALGQAEHSDVLTGWTWLAALGPRTCPACWGMNGTVHDLTDPGPNGHQNCRCSRVPTVKPWSELGIKVKEPKPALPDADDQFARLSPAQQQQVLGQRGYAAWSQGKFPRSQWATRQQNPGWRDSYVPARPPKVPKVATPTAPKKPARAKATSTRVAADPLKDLPKINPQLLANMEKRGIDVTEWNRRATNPKYGTDPAYGVNCQRVVQAHELRRRGYDVTAKPNPGDGSDRANVFLRWADGAEARMRDSGRYLVSPDTLRLVRQQSPGAAAEMISDAERYVSDVVKAWPVGGRGWVMFYRDAGAGHIFNIERTATGARVVEAQVPAGGEQVTLGHYMSQVRKTKRRNGTLQLQGHAVFVARVDDLSFNSGVLEAIT